MSSEWFLFPFPPSMNTLYMQGPKHGQKFLTKKGKEYKEKLRYLYADDARTPLSGDVLVHLYLLKPPHKMGDLDNYTKAIFDGLTWLDIIEDDSQIVTYKVSYCGKHNILTKGGVFIYVCTTYDHFHVPYSITTEHLIHNADEMFYKKNKDKHDKE